MEKIAIQEGDNKTPKQLIASKKPIPGSAAQQCATAAPVHRPAPVQQIKVQRKHGNLDKHINTNTYVNMPDSPENRSTNIFKNNNINKSNKNNNKIPSSSSSSSYTSSSSSSEDENKVDCIMTKDKLVA